MSLLRALQRQSIPSDLPARSPTEGALHLVSQTLTPDTSSTSSSSSSSEHNHHHRSLSNAVNGTVASSTLRPTLSSVFRRDNLTVGTRVIIAQDADLRGEISVGSGTVIHPKATILALQGSISIGSNCIIEETAVIVNRSSNPVKIGDNNLFEVGCRIEAASVGSHNVFEVRSRVAHNVKIGSYSVIGAGCTVLPKPITDDQLASIFDDDNDGAQATEAVAAEPYTIEEKSAEPAMSADTAAAEPKPESIDKPSISNDREEAVFEELPDQTIVFGADNRRRLWSGEGAQQQAALHAKHLEYLRDAIPRTHKLKIIQGVRSTPSSAPNTAP